MHAHVRGCSLRIRAVDRNSQETQTTAAMNKQERELAVEKASPGRDPEAELCAREERTVRLGGIWCNQMTTNKPV